MYLSTRYSWAVGLVCGCLAAITAAPVSGQATRGPRDFNDGDQYNNRYRDSVFADNPYVDPRRTTEGRNAVEARRANANRYARDDDSFSEVYPHVPPTRAPRAVADEPLPEVPRTRTYDRYHRVEGVVRNNYAGAPVYRRYYGGSDRYDAPGYLDDGGRASAMANGYARRGVAEFIDGYGRGVRTNDVYPLKRDVNPRRYRGRFLNGEVSNDDEDLSGANELEDFVRSELSTRPGANLRVSSTGTYTFRNYVDQGNQVNARFRIPVHRRSAYMRGP